MRNAHLSVVVACCCFPGVVPAENHIINLQTSQLSRYLAAEGGGGREVNANRTQPNAWEAFTLVDHNVERLRLGDEVSIKTRTGHFFTARAGAGQQIRADATVVGERERFIVCAAAAAALCPPPQVGPVISDGSHIRLMTVDGQLLLTSPGGDGALLTRAIGNGRPGQNETFVLRLKGSPVPESLSGPFSKPQLIAPIVDGVDHKQPPSGNLFDCENFAGRPFPSCYGGHEGTDFGLIGGFGTMNLDSIDVLAAASGTVVNVEDGNVDRCYFSPPMERPRGTRPAQDYVYCPPENALPHVWNAVTVFQDDGLVARYGHLKLGSITVTTGNRIECGQLLGKIGSSGISAGPHLHFDLARLKPETLVPEPGSTEWPSLGACVGSCSGKSDVVDPYEPNNGRPRLWAQVSLNQIPKRTCVEVSADHGRSPGLPGRVGTNCNTAAQCRPGLVCSSDSKCEIPRDIGQVCAKETGCKTSLTCASQMCTAHGVPVGGRCGAAEKCGPGLECSDSGRCRLPASDCPAGMTLRCPLPCIRNRTGECVLPGLRGEQPCDLACLP